MPDIRSLDRWITIVAAAETVDASGSAIEDWSAATTVCSGWSAWKSITRESDLERDAAGTLIASVFYDVWIRHRTDVLPKHRILSDSPVRTFDILSVTNEFESRQRWLRLRVRENLNG